MMIESKINENHQSKFRFPFRFPHVWMDLNNECKSSS